MRRRNGRGRKADEKAAYSFLVEVELVPFASGMLR